MKVTAFLAAIGLGALVGGLGVLLRDEPVRFVLIAEMAAATERSFLEAVARRKLPPSPVSGVLLVDLSPMSENSPSGNRSAPASGTDRRTIAAALDTLRLTPRAPYLVVLDVDIAPPADASDFRTEEEARLLESLDAWKRAPAAAPLLLVRGEGCASPLNHATRVLPLPWKNSPYDLLAAPTASEATRIAWTCSLPFLSRDGAARSFHPMGCASRKTDWGERFPVPSPGEWAKSGVQQASPTVDLTATYRRLLPAWRKACLQESGGGAFPRPVPFPPRQSNETDAPIAVSQLTEFATRGELDSRVIVLGRWDARSGDQWVGSSGQLTPGAHLVADHVYAALRYRGRTELGTYSGIGLVFLLGGGLGALYWSVRTARRPLVRWLGKWRTLRGLPVWITRIAFSPPVLGIILSLTTTMALVLGADLVAPNSWPVLWYVSVGCGTALALLDLALTEEKD